MTREERRKEANEIRKGVENDVEDLAAHFEGGIYGNDEEDEDDYQSVFKNGIIWEPIDTSPDDDYNLASDDIDYHTAYLGCGNAMPSEYFYKCHEHEGGHGHDLPEYED